MEVEIKLFLLEFRKLDTDDPFEEEEKYERIPTLSKSTFWNNLLIIFKGCQYNDRYLLTKSEDNHIAVFKHRDTTLLK